MAILVSHERPYVYLVISYALLNSVSLVADINVKCLFYCTYFFLHHCMFFSHYQTVNTFSYGFVICVLTNLWGTCLFAEFINLVSSESNEVCSREDKRIIAPEHVLKALEVFDRSNLLSQVLCHLVGSSIFCIQTMVYFLPILFWDDVWYLYF